jgi:hypothetical protein
VGAGGPVAGDGFGPGGISGCRGGLVRQGAVRPPGVAGAGEGVQEGLEFAGGGGWARDSSPALVVPDVKADAATAAGRTGCVQRPWRLASLLRAVFAGADEGLNQWGRQALELAEDRCQLSLALKRAHTSRAMLGYVGRPRRWLAFRCSLSS